MKALTGKRPIAGYTCSYIPPEILHAAGYTPVRLSGTDASCSHTDGDLSSNLCPWVHRIKKQVADADPQFAVIVLADSCDAMKKLKETLALSGVRTYLLSVPRKTGKAARIFFAEQLQNLMRFLTEGGHVAARAAEENLERSAALYGAVRKGLRDLKAAGSVPYSGIFSLLLDVTAAAPEKAITMIRAFGGGRFLPRAGLPIAVSGSPLPDASSFRILEDAGFEIVEHDSCLDRRWLGRDEGDIHAGGGDGDCTDGSPDPSGTYRRIAGNYLTSTPCARMETRTSEIDRIGALYPTSIKGIVHCRMPFCDLYGFDLMRLLRKTGKSAVLQVETDGTSQGQFKTRVEAFAEIVKGANKDKTAMQKTYKYFCGLDVGSTTIDAVLLDISGEVKGWEIVKTGPGAADSAEQTLQRLCAKAGISADDVYVLATGYGRDSLAFAQTALTEITCHAKGAVSLFPAAGMIIDIGGQDSKIIKLGKDGAVTDFQMNDKCAAGTGRFLEVMARALEIELPAMSDLALQAKEPASISSVCTVFAESEVVGLLGRGYGAPEIVAGIYAAIANRIEGMIKRVGLSEPVVITGGGALNRGLVRTLAARFAKAGEGKNGNAPQLKQDSVLVPDQPQIIGALGAALLAFEEQAGSGAGRK